MKNPWLCFIILVDTVIPTLQFFPSRSVAEAINASSGWKILAISVLSLNHILQRITHSLYSTGLESTVS